MSIKIYGIKSCDTMKKAFAWLDNHKVQYEFIDYRVNGITQKKIESWLKKIEANKLINIQSTTFKELPAEDKAKISEPELVAGLAFSNPTMIKRPLIECGKHVFVGYKPAEWEGVLN